MERIDYFETYVLVVQWTIAWLMLILDNLLDVKSKQDNAPVVFFHATFEEDKKSLLNDLLISSIMVPVDNAMLFISAKLFMIFQSPCVFWKYLTKNI